MSLLQVLKLPPPRKTGRTLETLDRGEAEPRPRRQATTDNAMGFTDGTVVKTKSGQLEYQRRIAEARPRLQQAAQARNPAMAAKKSAFAAAWQSMDSAAGQTDFDDALSRLPDVVAKAEEILAQEPVPVPAFKRDPTDKRSDKDIIESIEARSRKKYDELIVLAGRTPMDATIHPAEIEEALYVKGILKRRLKSQQPEVVMDEVLEFDPYNADRVRGVARIGKAADIERLKQAGLQAALDKQQQGLMAAAGGITKGSASAGLVKPIQREDGVPSTYAAPLPKGSPPAARPAAPPPVTLGAIKLDKQRQHTYAFSAGNENKTTEKQLAKPDVQARVAAGTGDPNPRINKMLKTLNGKSPGASLLNDKFDKPAAQDLVRQKVQAALDAGQGDVLGGGGRQLTVDMGEPTGWVVDPALNGVSTSKLRVDIAKDGQWHFFPVP